MLWQCIKYSMCDLICDVVACRAFLDKLPSLGHIASVSVRK